MSHPIRTLALIAALASLAPLSGAQTTYNRSLAPADVAFVPVGNGLFDVEVAAHYATQMGNQVNLGMELRVSVNGGFAGGTTLQAIGAGGGQTCQGSCPGDCTTLDPESTCADFVVIGGQGCACTAVVHGVVADIALQPNDTVDVTILPSQGALPEVYTLDDSVQQTFVPPTTYNRFIEASEISFTAAGNGTIEVGVNARYASQLANPADFSMDLMLLVNGNASGSTTLQAIGNGGGGQTCGGSCVTPDCSMFGSDSECLQLEPVGGFGCSCSVVVGAVFPALPIQTGDLVEVIAIPATGALPEIYTLDDSAQRTFPGLTTYNRSIAASDISFTPAGVGAFDIGVRASYSSQLPNPADLSMTVMLVINGNASGSLTLQAAAGGGGGQTCGGSCETPDCSALGSESECVDLVPITGAGCACTAVVSGVFPALPIQVGDLVEVITLAANGALPELYTLDDSAQRTFSGLTTYNRSLAAHDIAFTPRGPGTFDIGLSARYGSQLANPADLSMEAVLFVNGNFATSTTLQAIAGGGGGQTCGGSCVTPDCSALGPESVCVDLVPFGGFGCTCTVVIGGVYPAVSLQAGDTVEILLMAANAALPEIYTLDDSATTTFRGTLGSNYCVAGQNSAGLGSTMFGAGSTVITDNAFTLYATGLPANVFGLFYYGAQQFQLPFGEGFRCVGGGVVRLSPASAADGLGRLIRSVDLSSAQNISAGNTLNFQAWYRDFAGGPSGFNLSDGLEVTFQ